MPPDFGMQSDFSRMRNLSEHQRTGSSLWISILPHFFLPLFAPASFSPSCGAAYQAGILSATSRPEMADVEQMKKSVPKVTCEITFGQYVCELVFGVNVSNLKFRININPIKQPIQSNSVGS